LRSPFLPQLEAFLSWKHAISFSGTPSVVLLWAREDCLRRRGCGPFGFFLSFRNVLQNNQTFDYRSSPL